jgi:hypothetical protein
MGLMVTPSMPTQGTQVDPFGRSNQDPRRVALTMSNRTQFLVLASRYLGTLIGWLHTLDDQLGAWWIRSLPERERDSILNGDKADG